MSCIDKHDSCCPFAFTDMSERVQNYGCLPTPAEIVTMRVEHGKTWACHNKPDQPCVGAIRHLKRSGKPHKIIDLELLNEQSTWHLYTREAA